VRPRVNVYPTFAPQLADCLAVNDAKFKAKSVAHLFSPLNLERRRANNKD
jgi:hypothetical protein